MNVTIYHNPRCSKSRQTLAILEASGVQPNIVRYLETPLKKEDVRQILNQLGFEDPRQLMRQGEAIYKDMSLKDETRPEALIDAMVAHPKLMERPIVVRNGKAVLGRPPENINKLLS